MKIHLILAIALTIIISPSFAQKAQTFSTKDGAIKGYDPVAYFKNQAAVKGSDEYSFEWNEAVWRFSSEENLTAFKENPEEFAPQFGGYCAYAVSQGYTYRVNPEAWKIVDGKLYLNYSQGIKKKWEANQVEFIKKGNTNWPKVLE
ncbi:MAG: YHS domain-containing (seleno)protein [Cyclobacteriaceae bacterium]